MKEKLKKNPVKKTLKPVSISVKCFQETSSPDPLKVKQGILSILSAENRVVSGHLTVCFVGDSLIKDLNQRYLQRDSTTDVLAFNYGSKSKALSADIVICVDEARRNAERFKTTPEYELYLYVAHGLLHLLGYDDRSSRAEKLMRQKEQKYVNYFLDNR